MKKYSEDKFELKSPLTPKEIIDRLQNCSLKKKLLTMSLTSKDFIGRVDQESFSLISSSFPIPYGAACVLKGEIGTASKISLTTTLHKAFRILFLVWFAIMTVAVLIFWLRDSATFSSLLAIIIGMPIIGLIFRLYLHGMYVLARNQALKKIKDILEVIE